MNNSISKFFSIIFLLFCALGFAQQSQTIVQNTPGTYTFTVPAGVTEVTVATWGAGGRGGSGNQTNLPAPNDGFGTYGGGGGGAYSRSVIAVTPGQVITYVVGAGSTTAAAGGFSNATLGGTVIVRANGGNSVANNATAGATGGIATTGIGTVRFAGGNGAARVTLPGGGGSSSGTAVNGNNASGTAGGTAPAGGGNGGTASNSSATPPAQLAGAQPGGGGAGSVYSNTGAGGVGGPGGNGRVQLSFIRTATPRDCISGTSSAAQLTFQNGTATTVNGNTARRFTNVANNINAEVVDLGGFVTSIDTDVVASPASLTSVLNTNIAGDRSSLLQINFYNATIGNGFTTPIQLNFYATAFDIDGGGGTTTLREYVELSSPDAFAQETTGSSVNITESGFFPTGTIRGQSNTATINDDGTSLENLDFAFTSYYVNRSSFNYRVGKIGNAEGERFFTLAFRDVVYTNPNRTFSTNPAICGISRIGGAPQPGVRIELYNSANTFITSAITDSNGAFQFDLGPNSSGSYFIREINPTEVISTSDSDGGPNFDQVQVSINLNSADVSFGNIALDTDNDGIPNNVDIDDDGDGILDVNENGCFTTAVTSSTGVSNPGNITGAVNGTVASWTTNGNIAVFDFGQVYPAGTRYQFTWKRVAGQTGTAIPIINESSKPWLWICPQSQCTTIQSG